MFFCNISNQRKKAQLGSLYCIADIAGIGIFPYRGHQSIKYKHNQQWFAEEGLINCVWNHFPPV